MILVKTEIEISNPMENLNPVLTECLVDSGALHLCIPETLAIQLKLQEFEKRTVTLTDGRTQMVSYVGPVKVDWNNRVSFTGALVLGTQVLLGAIPMEDMDILIHPAQQKVIANPQHPNIPASVVM